MLRRSKYVLLACCLCLFLAACTEPEAPNHTEPVVTTAGTTVPQQTTEPEQTTVPSETTAQTTAATEPRNTTEATIEQITEETTPTPTQPAVQEQTVPAEDKPQPVLPPGAGNPQEKPGDDVIQLPAVDFD